MPYAAVEELYSSLTLEKQKEAYDFICFLVQSQEPQKPTLSPKDSYSEGFFNLFGACKDESFVSPEDNPTLSSLNLNSVPSTAKITF